MPSGSTSRPAPRAGRTGAPATIALAAALCASACSSGSPESKQAAGAPVSAGPSGPVLYVSNETAGTVAILDGSTGAVEAQVAVGKRPRGVKLSRDGSRLFVALSGSPIGGPGVDESKLPPADRSADGIGVVDLASRKVERIYPSGPDPEAFDVSPDGKTLYVSNEDTSAVAVVDLDKGVVAKSVSICGEPEGVTVAPDGRTVYVTCEADGAVAAIDTTSFQVLAQIPTAPRPRGIVFSRDGGTIFVTCENGAGLTVIDAATHKATGKIALTIPGVNEFPARPMGALLSRDGQQLFVTTGRAKAVVTVDPATRQQTRVIQDVGARPWGIAVSLDGARLYTANGPSGDVSFIDAAKGVVERRVSIGGSPWGVVVGARR